MRAFDHDTRRRAAGMALAAAIAACAPTHGQAQPVTQAPANDPTMAPWMTAPEPTAPNGQARPSGAGQPNANGTQAAPPQGRQGIAQPQGPYAPSGNGAQTGPAAPPTGDHFGGTAADETDATESLGLIQGAWSNPRAHMGQGQTSPGVKVVDWTPTSMPVVINMRAQMLTLVTLPQDEEIVRIVFNDTNTFTALISPDRHSAQVKARNAGVDGNAVIIGKSGNNYPVYMRTTSYRSDRIPDMSVILRVRGMASSAEVEGASPASGDLTPDERRARQYSSARYDDDPTARLTMRPRADMTKPGQDYSARGLTGPGRIRNDLDIRVARPEDAIIAPVAAWRTDRFTYLDFGPRATSMNTWPAASIVIDGVDSPIGSRVSGPNRSVMIVEGIGDVTLTSGTHVVCIVTRLVDGDPRHPVVDEPYRNHAHPGDRGVDVTRPRTAAIPPLEGPRPDDYGTPPPAAVTRTAATPGAMAAPAVSPPAMAQPAPRPAPQAAMAAPTPPIAPPSGQPGTRIVAGPYEREAATKAAFDIRAGLDANAPAMAAVVPKTGRGDNVQAATASAAAADSLCESIRRAGHACKTY